MIAKIFDISNGITIYDDVKLVRIKSKNCNYLIMEDHTPVLGEINGRITIINKKEDIFLNDIKGYFVYKNNSFELIVEEKFVT